MLYVALDITYTQVVDEELRLSNVLFGFILFFSTAMAYLFFALALNITSSANSTTQIQPSFNDFININQNSLNLGEKFDVEFKTPLIDKLNKQQLALYLCCKEEVSVRAGGDSGYNKINELFTQKITFNYSHLQGAKVELRIPEHYPASYNGLWYSTKWLLILVEDGAPLDVPEYEKNTSKHELNVLPALDNPQNFTPIKPDIENVVSNHIEVVLDSHLHSESQFSVVEVGNNVSGLLKLTAPKNVLAKKYNLELCCIVFDKFEVKQNLKISVPKLAAEEKYEYPFSFVISENGPLSTMSNDQLLKVRWCVRIRSNADWLFDLEIERSYFVVVPSGYSRQMIKQRARRV